MLPFVIAGGEGVVGRGTSFGVAGGRATSAGSTEALPFGLIGVWVEASAEGLTGNVAVASTVVVSSGMDAPLTGGAS